jgi:hypothetical protein
MMFGLCAVPRIAKPRHRRHCEIAHHGAAIPQFGNLGISFASRD